MLVYNSLDMSQKGQWPEVVGLHSAEAEKVIHADDASINIQVLPQGSATTRDFRINRVRVFVNGEGVVVDPPRRG